MAKILPTKSIYFNDVVILPGITQVNSRKEIQKELNRIIVSPMPAVVGYTFAKKALELGLTVCLHRFCSIEDEANLYVKLCENIEEELRANIYPAIGLYDIDRLRALYHVGCNNFLLDIANGTVPKVRDFCRYLKPYNLYGFMAGNVVSKEGVDHLWLSMKYACAQKYIIRIGQGNGVSCQTSDETGINRGQITELMECREWIGTHNQSLWLASDGGINKAGSICKAFGAGADAVLIGGMFAKTEEAETNISGDGSYFGCASEKAQKLLKGEAFRHTEGKELQLKGDLIPLEKLVDQLWGGISSCISYTGYKSVSDFIGKAVFEVKQNSLPPKTRY